MVIMRGAHEWTQKVKGLKGRTLQLNSWQNVALSPHNFEGQGFKKVVSAICQSLC